MISSEPSTMSARNICRCMSQSSSSGITTARTRTSSAPQYQRAEAQTEKDKGVHSVKRPITVVLTLSLLWASALVGQDSNPPAPGPTLSSQEKEQESTESEQRPTNYQRATKEAPVAIERIDSKPENEKAADQSADEKYQSTWERRGTIANIVISAFTIVLAFISLLMYLNGRDTARRQLRAYVFINKAKLSRHPSNDGPWYILLAVKNYGATPATDAIFKVEWAIMPVIGEETILQFSERSQCEKATIAPHHHCTTKITISLSSNMSIERAASHMVYVWGRVDYADAFRRPRFMTFQMVNDLAEVNEFAYTQKGNHAV